MTTLQEIGNKYGTDKSRHKYRNISYLDIYDQYFNSIRYNVKTVLEIGVLNGQSLLMWRDYFPNAIIYGVDINPDCKQFETNKIKIIIGDQNDENFLNQLKKDIGTCNIILDDGSHITNHQIKTFNVLYDLVERGGYYIIEDLRNSYEEFSGGHDLRKIWPGMKYNNPDDLLINHRKDFDDWVEQKIKELDFHSENNLLMAIHHHPMIIIFENSK